TGPLAGAPAPPRRCLGLLPPNDPLRPFVTQQLRQCERSLALEVKLPALLRAGAKPADAAERLDLAQVCRWKRLYAASARFYAQAFTDQPELADDLGQGHRHHAACAAALAAAGRGGPAGTPDGQRPDRP